MKHLSICLVGGLLLVMGVMSACGAEPAPEVVIVEREVIEEVEATAPPEQEISAEVRRGDTAG